MERNDWTVSSGMSGHFAAEYAYISGFTYKNTMGRSRMLIKEPLPFTRDYVDMLYDATNKCRPEQQLTRIQRTWLSFCVMAIITT